MFSRDLDSLLESVPIRTGAPRIVLIDGPSGAGKSTLATELADAWRDPITVVRLDDLYPGWHGLAAGSEQVGRIVAEFRRRRSTGWQRWDWLEGAAAEFVPVPLHIDLLIEGCGAVSGLSAAHADLAIWVTASDPVRKTRALARDHGHFDEHWSMWDEQFEAFVRRQRPKSLCHITMDTTEATPAFRRHRR